MKERFPEGFRVPFKGVEYHPILDDLETNATFISSTSLAANITFHVVSDALLEATLASSTNLLAALA